MNNNNVSPDLSYLKNLNLPGFPGSKKEILRKREESERFKERALAHPGAKRFCQKCETPIYDEGECPNCN